jgi:nucleoside 2-deoxyribosyltransferase
MSMRVYLAGPDVFLVNAQDVGIRKQAICARYGLVAVGLNGMPWGISRLIAGLSADFYRAEVDSIFAAFAGFDEPDAWENVKTQA